jgi:hypothetical protein
VQNEYRNIRIDYELYIGDELRHFCLIIFIIRSQMYYDLSLLPTNTLELNHLLTALQDSAYGTVAVDYEFADTLVTPPPESFQKLKVPMA